MVPSERSIATYGSVAFVCADGETCVVNPVDVPVLVTPEARIARMASDVPIDKRIKAMNTRGLDAPASGDLLCFISNLSALTCSAQFQDGRLSFSGGIQAGYQEEVTRRFGFRSETDVCRRIFLFHLEIFVIDTVTAC